MSSLEISIICVLSLVASVQLGMWLQDRLPDHHRTKESQDTIKLGAGIVGTMSALILGLLVSSAKGSFDAVNSAIAQNGAKIIEIDRLLAQYGSESRDVRDQLKNSVAERVQKVWGKSSDGDSGLHAIEKSTTMLDIQTSLRALSPQTDLQKNLLNQCLQISNEVWQSRLLITEEQQAPVPPVFLVLLVFWLTLLFMSFGLFAPRNATVCVVLLVCAVSVSSSVFLILEMSRPLDGMIKVSSAPLLKALQLIGH